jgi:hydroxyacylglutathione hydrolase
MKIYTFETGVMKENCYFILDEKENEGLVIDPGDDGQYLLAKFSEFGVTPQAIIATHGHFDHIMAVCELQLAYSIGFFIHKKDVFLVDRMEESAKHFLQVETGPKPHIDGYIEDHDKITVGSSVGEVIPLPGHTPGGIGIWFPEEKALFTGDTLFAGGIVGRTDLSYSNKTDLAISINTILRLPEDTVLYPGHGEPSTVLAEKTLRDNQKI